MKDKEEEEGSARKMRRERLKKWAKKMRYKRNKGEDGDEKNVLEGGE